MGGAIRDDFLQKLQSQHSGMRVTEDESVFRDWVCLYPVYFDVKRSLQGGRKMPKALCVEGPHARQLAEAVKQVGLNVCYEPHKTHPRDFFNQGRVRVQLMNKDKTPCRPDIPSRRALMQKIGEVLPSIDVEREPEPTLEDILGAGGPGMGGLMPNSAGDGPTPTTGGTAIKTEGGPSGKKKKKAAANAAITGGGGKKGKGKGKKGKQTLV
ncbi:signal recognition particle subunit [Spiromyces aspiralis]|uniref:Signal recognition particle subunit n=1 Tax=Spiromyces aspiralis TaxID=68401 RepID=A0ACC1HQT9_9FUNG|nr:signal recognition particle subunit [Spiromyces aspiralis]